MKIKLPHIPSASLDNYKNIVGKEKIQEIKKAAWPLRHKHVVHVNSTYSGGGVAEMLNTIVLLLNDIGISCGWRLLKGTTSFFEITKSFHNALQGANIELTDKTKNLYENVIEYNSIFTHLDNHDLIVVHDPQPLPLIKFLKKNQKWIWRCHIDLTAPHPEPWNYLKQYIKKYDEMIISDEKYRKKDIRIPQTIICPSIDPLNEKNKKLSDEEAKKIVSSLGVPLDKPLVAQISRYDTWKDPLGVLEIFKKIKKEVDCRLVYVGNVADDDPEAVRIYKKTIEKAGKIAGAHFLVNIPNNDISVNAIQKIAEIIFQKSIREGFAITVSEALWKETPVIASAVGGIPLQIVDGKNGFLIDDPLDYDKFAEKAVGLLRNKEERIEMGRFGKQYVKEKFLVTRHVLDYINLFKRHLL